MDSNRISNTPLYDDTSLDEIYKEFDSQPHGESAEPKADYQLETIPEVSLLSDNFRILETKYLTKKHRFFKVKVKKECRDEAMERLERRLRSLIEEYSGDLQVCKAVGAQDICCYFIVSDEVDCDKWVAEFEKILEGMMVPGSHPVMLEMRAYR